MEGSKYGIIALRKFINQMITRMHGHAIKLDNGWHRTYTTMMFEVIYFQSLLKMRGQA
jgi:hypothetical protein